jgi:hypothetical protein
MTPEKRESSLRYMVSTLRQISVVLRDFELEDTAALLDVATTNLEAKLVSKAQAEHHTR